MKKILIILIFITINSLIAKNLKITPPQNLHNNQLLLKSKTHLINNNKKSINNKNPNQFKSDLLNELDVVLDKINKKDIQRKIKLKKEQEKLEIERKKLQNVKRGLEKERMSKGIIVQDDITREKTKLNNKKQLLQQKIQYAQVQEQYNAIDLNSLKKEINSRINTYTNLQNLINKFYIITSDEFDYVKIGNENIAYVKSDAISSIIDETLNDTTTYKDYELKKIRLKEAENMTSINKIKQILSTTSININTKNNSFKRNISTSINNNNNNQKYIKISEKQLLSENLIVDKITDSIIQLKRK